MNLLDQRCSNHSLREAAVECPSCKRFFCRECVTEHQGRMICVSCVTILEPTAPHTRQKTVWILTSAAGLLIAWLIFYYLGQSLARIPSEFHAEMWRKHPRNTSVRKMGTGSNFRRLCEISCLYPFCPVPNSTRFS